MEGKKEIKIKVESSEDNECCNPDNYFSIGNLLYKTMERKCCHEMLL